MDVSYSAWKHSAEERMVLKGGSFSFLFDRRYTNRLNRMSRIFFEAYSKATKELALSEDRFPSLSEIDARMESGAVYAFKDRLAKNTEFFEEVKISGVSYLVPRAKRFVDGTGTYTDLAFSFEEGLVLLPTRRKIPAPEEDIAFKPEEVEPKKEPILLPPEQAEAVQPASLDAGAEEMKPSEAEDEQIQQYPSHISEPYKEEEQEEEEKEIDKELAEEPSLEVAPGPEEKKWGFFGKDEGRDRIRSAALVLVSAALILALGAYLLGSFSPAGAPKLVQYSSYLTNVTQGDYLGLDINNVEGISNELEMVLPPNIDKIISSRGGIITISHAGNTIIKLNSSSNANIRIYLSSNLSRVPVTLNLGIPPGYSSGLTVNGTNYDIKHKDDLIILRFNSTHEGISFEQSYSPKR